MSAIRIKIEQSEFQAGVCAYSDEIFNQFQTRQDVFAFRRKHEPPGAQILLIPLTDSIPAECGKLIPFESAHQLRFLAALIEHRLPTLIPEFNLQPKRFGLERVSQEPKHDLVNLASQKVQSARTEKLGIFHKRLRTRIRVRHEFMPGYGSVVALAFEFDHQFSIDGLAADLLKYGFSLDGLGLTSADNLKTWHGHVRGSEGQQIIVAGEHGDTRIDARYCKVEPNAAAFKLLFKQILGARELENFEDALRESQIEVLSGKGYLNRLQHTAHYFSNKRSLGIARGLSISFGDLLNASFSGTSPAAAVLPEIEYCFSADRTAIHTIPFQGLDIYGPFDNRRFDKKEPRILFVCPTEARDLADRFLRRLIEGMAKDGMQRFARGFVGTYRLTRANPSFLTIDLPRSNSIDIGSLYVKKIRDEFDPSRCPDIAFILIRDEDAFIEKGNPYLASKAYLLSQGIPSQEVRLSRIQQPLTSLQYILENIAVATYAKLGGCPWTLMPTLPLTKEVVMGMAYAEVGGRFESRRRYMGITTVFTSDGTYVLASKSPRCLFEDYPDVLAATVKDTIKQLIKDYGWGAGDIVRLVFHTAKPLTKHDISTVARVAMTELGAEVQFECAFLTIAKEHPFKLIVPYVSDPRNSSGSRRITGAPEPTSTGPYVPERGTIVDLGHRTRLVCVQGSSLIPREAIGIPQPLLVRLDPASTYKDLSALTRQVYNFTGLSWGSMKPIAEPVTIRYARLIAKMLSQLDGHPEWSENLIDTRLRKSRWFL